MANKKNNMHQRVINEIRANYKIGDPDAVFLQSELNRALDLLSKDLYSKKSHFILELVQNADDNKYHVDVKPRLEISVTESCLVLTNNEVGFEEKNVRAICQTGSSSKREKKGYIGEKGIGFKSVFTISEMPEIHSNGYHFKFDRTDPENLLGYVVPIWCEQDNKFDKNLTTIILPAANNYKFEENTLAELNAHLLLFLNKLRYLSVEHNGTKKTYIRDDINGQTILTTRVKNPTIQEDVIERYLRIDHLFAIQSDCLDEEKRPKISESSIVLAFPINEKGAVAPDRSSYIHSFLPVSQVGFKFAIQADFILSTNREGVLTDRAWNTNIRDEIAEAFMKAVEIFKTNEQNSLNFLKYVPAADDIVDPFYQDVRDSIISNLIDSECILSASNNWHRPNSLRKANKLFRELFPSSIALELFGFDYINTKIRGVDDVLEELGIETAGIYEALSIFRDYDVWLANQPIEWKSKFYAYIADNQDEALSFGLLDLPCLPVSNGKFVVPNKSTVYFPLSKLEKYGFEHELTIIDFNTYEAALAYSKENVSNLFESMSVRADNPYELITGHIFSKHQTESWKSSDNNALIGHLRYVKDKLNDYIAHSEKLGISETSAIKDLKDKLWIGTKQRDEAWVFSKIQYLYISKEYKPLFCIESLLGEGIDQVKVVSHEYLSRARNKESHSESWRDFLIKLGIRVSPALEQLKGDWGCSRELQLLLESEHSTIRKATLECINQNWDKYSDCIATVQIVRGNYTEHPTAFAKILRSTTAPTNRRLSVTLAESYYATDEITSVFGNELPFLDALLDEPMLIACHVTYKVDAISLVRRLIEYRNGANSSNRKIQAIYRMLDDRFWGSYSKYIVESFNSHGLIRLTGSRKGWYRPNELCWNSSNINFIDNLYPSISSSYRDFNRFLVDRLRVPKTLPIQKYVTALTSLHLIENRQERCDIALSIYRRANSDLMPKGDNKAELPLWLDIFQNKAVFINQRGEIVTKDSNLFANDMPELAALFEKDDCISILDVSTNEVPRLSRLLLAAEVPLISKSVTIEVIDSEPGIIDQELTDKLRRSLIYFARVVYSKRHAEFENAVAKGLFGALRKFNIVEVSNVALLVKLQNYVHEATTDIAVTNNRLLYQTDTKSLKDRIAKKICEQLDITSDLEDAFARILTETNDIGIEDYLSLKNIRELPRDVYNELFTENNFANDEDIDKSLNDLNGQNVEDSSFTEEDDIRVENNNNHEIPKRNEPGDISSQSDDSNKENSSKPVPTKQVAMTDESSIKSPASSVSKNNSENEDRNSSETPKNLKMPINDTEPQSPEANQKKNPDSGSMFQNSTDQSRNSTASIGQSKIQPARTSSGQLMSYATGSTTSTTGADQDNPAKSAARKATELAAVKYFMDTQADKWQTLTVMKDNNPGFDIYAINKDGQEEFIEVKGQSRAWTTEGVALTPRELITANEKGNRYWLCVVEFAQDEKRRQLHLVNNPFGLTTQFRFDSGWKTAAKSYSSRPQYPIKDMYIEIHNVGHGRIVSVRKNGKLYSINVHLKNGSKLNKVFNPATMKLSEEPTWQE